ncbi:type II toxin-antitoxin system Phd/YefM family antitoxin [Longimicrobium sp.]|uniref:type II toxin-antitoxin system Phd/YefM family antitoxin n=1 Tax=Longimicrobium sp. TaxID=2029185 RepID=UPI002BC2E7A0|nr:type II toxin-antitoxin system Phd/YefM family antitoxin [Longimicrobium sp.]HSU12626.1 type II toxin-antitoxin system Phd/YefM family antitoxin [Longimicrobium sp.]
MNNWKLEDAKNRFSEVVRLALSDQPQRVTRNGRDAVVVISAAEYDRLSAPPQNLFEFLQSSPLAKAIAEDGIDFEIERDQDVPRDIDFD